MALLCVGLGSRAVQAEPRLFVDLDYQTDAALGGCPSEAAFRAMVRDQLGYDPFRADSPQKVVARAHASEPGIRGFVRWSDASGTPRGERELSSERSDCAEFARVMSFAIAVQIQLLGEEADEQRSKHEPPGTPGSVAPPGPPPNPVREEQRGPIVERPSAEPSGWQLMIGAGPALGVGIAPEPAVAGRLFTTVQYDRLAVELGAEATLPSRHETTNGEGFEQQVVLGSLAGCLFVRRLSGCVVNKWGRLQVRGFGVDIPRSASGLLAQIGPRLALTKAIAKRWTGALRVEALATLMPWDVSLDQREVWRTPALSVAIGADLAAVFRDNTEPTSTLP
jgi:hypothetical protein